MPGTALQEIAHWFLELKNQKQIWPIFDIFDREIDPESRLKQISTNAFAISVIFFSR